MTMWILDNRGLVVLRDRESIKKALADTRLLMVGGFDRGRKGEVLGEFKYKEGCEPKEEKPVEMTRREAVDEMVSMAGFFNGEAKRGRPRKGEKP